MYNEKIFDLLNPESMLTESAGLPLHFQDKTFVAHGLYTFKCKSKENVNDLFNFGANIRFKVAHKLRHISSRSHSILTLTLESISLTDPVTTSI